MPTLHLEVEPFDAVSAKAPCVRGSWRAKGRPASSLRHAALLLALALASIAIDGYHPYAEDAGIYVAGIKLVAHPGLYGSSAAFIEPYFRWSYFSQWSALLVRALHIPLGFLLLIAQIATTWLLLYACWALAKLCFRRPEVQWASVALAAVFLCCPVAGSGLFLADPYLTARSFSTPLTLLAIAACLDRRMMRAGLLVALAALFHPLMAIYAAAFVALLCAVERNSRWAIAALFAAAFTAAGSVQFSQRLVADSAAHQAAVATRAYYFLYRWHWYEISGVILPLLLLAAYGLWLRESPPPVGPHHANRSALTRTCVLIGLTSIAISLLFARPAGHSHLIAALQTIRPFVFIYYCMFLLLGGALGKFWLRRVAWRWTVTIGSLALVLAFLQHHTFAASPQVELPWTANGNGWSRAFLWIRGNTPADAVVALNAHYIDAPGEDAQGFRAIAERDTLADFSKDGGAAAAFPQLAERWRRETAVTTDLNQIDDAERLRRLVPFHVTWIVLERSAHTSLRCPFEDDRVMVCRLEQ